MANLGLLDKIIYSSTVIRFLNWEIMYIQLYIRSSEFVIIIKSIFSLYELRNTIKFCIRIGCPVLVGNFNGNIVQCADCIFVFKSGLLDV